MSRRLERLRVFTREMVGDDKDQLGHGSNKRTYFVTVEHSKKEGGLGPRTSFSRRFLAASEQDAHAQALRHAADIGHGRSSPRVTGSRMLTGEHEQLK